MFSQTVEYALRAVVHLADQFPSARTTEQIADATLVPKPYLSKVLQALRSTGIVQLKRGIGGGVALTRSPAKLSILDVVNAVEPIQRIRTCPLGLKSHGLRLCRLHKRLDTALAMVEDAFGSTTLDKVVAETATSRPLCDIPSGRRISIK